MSRKLSDNETLKLVQLYREHECLWNIRSSSYKNKQMRTSALKAIRDGMEINNFDIDEVKAKIKSVRGTYYLELDKIEKSRRSGAGGEIYKPRIQWFDELHGFIKQVMIKRKTKDNTANRSSASGTENDSSESSASVLTNDENRPQSSASVATSETNTDVTKPKRSKRSQLISMIAEMNKMNDNTHNVQEEENDCDLFGKYIGSQLNKLTEEQQIIAQDEIQSVLSKARLADLRFKNNRFSNYSGSSDFTTTQHFSTMEHSAPLKTMNTNNTINQPFILPPRPLSSSVSQYSQLTSPNRVPTSPQSTITTSEGLGIIDYDFNYDFTEETPNIIARAFDNA